MTRLLKEYINSIVLNDTYINEELSDKSIFYIQLSGFNRPHLYDFSQSESFVNNAIDDRTLIFIDYSGEGPHISRPYMEALIAFASRHKIDINRCILFSQNIFTLKELNRSIPSNSSLFSEELNWSYGNMYLWRALHEYQQVFSLDGIDESLFTNSDVKDFLCLNFAPRVHRLALYAYLHNHGYLERSHFSFRIDAKPEAMNAKRPELFERTKRTFPVLSSEIDALAALPNLNMYLDTSNDAQVPDLVFSYPIEATQNSIWTLVTETGMQNGIVQRITEKTIKPIAYERPFLIFGEPYSLQFIRDLGFHTFSEVIDESYDTIESPIERFMELTKIVKSLSGKSYNNYERSRIIDICRHNKSWLANGLNQRLVEVGATYLKEALMRAGF